MVENNFPNRILLNMTDATIYMSYFDHAPIPKKNAGRGVIAINEVPYEFQTALVFEEENYEKKLNYVIDELNKYIPNKATKVSIIPDEVTYEMLAPSIGGIDEVPLGISLKTAQPYLYDLDRKITVFMSNSYAAGQKFFDKTLKIMKDINGYKMIVINSTQNIVLEDVEGFKYYESGFPKLLQSLNANINKLQEESENKFLILFMGYGSLQEELTKLQEENDDIVTVSDLIDNASENPNFKFIIYDTPSGISPMENDSIDKYFKRDFGVWIGKKSNNQNIFEANEYLDDDSFKNDTLILLEKGVSERLKF